MPPLTAQERYVHHALGIVHFLKWIEDWDKKKETYTIKDSVVLLNEGPSQRFTIGVPNKKAFGEYPFLAVQDYEKQWAKPISWNRAEIRLGTRRLYLISDRIPGDGERFPDMPATAVSIAFDVEEKLHGLAQSDFLECRGIWFNEDNDLQVENGPALWRVPLTVQADDVPILNEEEVSVHRTMDDLLRQELNSVGGWPTAFNDEADQMVGNTKSNLMNKAKSKRSSRE